MHELNFFFHTGGGGFSLAARKLKIKLRKTHHVQGVGWLSFPSAARTHGSNLIQNGCVYTFLAVSGNRKASNIRTTT
jgi:hypothetical protein